MAKLLQAIFFDQPHFSKSILLKAVDIHFVMIFSFFLFSNNLASQTTIESINDGSWNSTDTWDEGVIPTSPDYATISLMMDLPMPTGLFTKCATPMNLLFADREQVLILIGYSYDLNFSGLNAFNNGTHEIMLSYNLNFFE